MNQEPMPSHVEAARRLCPDWSTPEGGARYREVLRELEALDSARSAVRLPMASAGGRTDTVTVACESGQWPGAPGEFEAFMEEALAEWEARTTGPNPEPLRGVARKILERLASAIVAEAVRQLVDSVAQKAASAAGQAPTQTGDLPLFPATAYELAKLASIYPAHKESGCCPNCLATRRGDASDIEHAEWCAVWREIRKAHAAGMVT